MLMDKLRRQTKLYLWIVVAAFVGWIFFQLGENIAARRKLKPWQKGVIAEVDGKPITYELFRQRLRMAIEDSLQTLGHSLTPEQRSKIEEAVFKSIITDAKLYDFYKQRRLFLDDNTVIALIQNFPPRELLNDPTFLDSSGNFDFNKYRQALANPQNAAFFRDYEVRLRTELPKYLMQADLLSTLSFTPEELWQLYKKEKEKVKVAYVAVVFPSIPDSEIKFTDADLLKFYKEHPDKFKRPAKASVLLVEFPKVPSSEDTLEAKLHAESILDELKLSDVEVNFDDLVKDYSEDTETRDKGGDLGWIDSSNKDLKPLYDAAIKMKKGEVGGPVLTQNGWHIFKVVDKKKGKVHLKHILIRIVTGPGTEAELREKAEDFIDLAKKEGFRKAAEEMGLKVRETSMFPIKSGFIPYIGHDEMLHEFIKKGNPGDISSVVRKPDKYVVIQINKKEPEHIPPFDEIKDWVKKVYIKEKKKELAREVMNKVYEEILKGEDMQKVAEKYKDKYVKYVEVPNYISRSQFLMDVGFKNEFFGAAFTLDKGQISKPVETTRGVYIIKVLDKKVPSKKQFEKEKDSYLNALLTRYINNLYSAWKSELEEGNIKDYRNYLLY